MANCQLEMLARTDTESLVKVTCAHCRDTRMIAVQVETPEETVPRIDVRDEALRADAGISTDEVLDVRLAMRQHQGDLKSLLTPRAVPDAL